MSGNIPICMAEEYWANTQLSIARHYGGIKFNGHEYLIVDKLGRDLWECSIAPDRAGSDKVFLDNNDSERRNHHTDAPAEMRQDKDGDDQRGSMPTGLGRV